VHASPAADVRVAVVVPCHDDGEFLRAALRSVAEQEPCELVVVDDGSRDPGTLALLDAFEAEGVRVVHQANQGLSGARMTGVAHTTARYVHPLDADDLLAPGALAALADTLDGHPEASAAWGEVQMFGAMEGRLPRAHDLDPWRLTHVTEVTGTTLVRRTAIEAVGGWDMGSGYEDWDFWLKLAGQGHLGLRIGQVTLLYRQHAGGRMYAQAFATRHDELVAALRARHRGVYGRRRELRRRSSSPRAIKLAWSVVEALPALSHRRRLQLLVVSRHYLQREMSPDAYRGLGERLASRLRSVGRRA
jgi:glycosyltransferase involved in cell wall biosynthesis